MPARHNHLIRQRRWVRVNHSLAPAVPAINFLHHFLCIRIRQHNLVNDLALVSGPLGNDSGHTIDIEIHSNEEGCAQVVFVRKHLVEMQYLRTTITEAQRQEFAAFSKIPFSKSIPGTFCPIPASAFPKTPV